MRVLLVAGLILPFLAGTAEGAFLQVRSAVHVHTDFSTGSLSLDETIEEARRQGIEALILTDNLLLRFEYGLFPFRSLLKKVVEWPSVRRSGVERYLRGVEAAQARSPDVLLIPGVEVVPYYYWTGSPFSRDLTHWDGQKNLLVVGLWKAEDYLAIPAIGNGKTLPLRGSSLVQLTLGLGTVGVGILLLRLKRERTIQLKHFAVRATKRYRLAGCLVLGVGALFLFDAVTAPPLTPYQGELGIKPYQQIIETAESRGGAVLWSFPEARDFRHRSLGPLGEVVIRTEPYPEALLQSRDYTGFGAVVPDSATVTDPGREWDQLLLEYADGRRARPAWGIGELGFHASPKALGEVLTVFLVPERSREAILQALKAGRLYGLHRRHDLALVLEDFSISQEGNNSRAPMGGELQANGRGALSIRLRIAASEGQSVPFTVRVVRSGKLQQVLEGRTPFSKVLRVRPPEPGRREFFRIEVTKPHWLLSNPIFVRRRG